jgi:hypothetical protein
MIGKKQKLGKFMHTFCTLLQRYTLLHTEVCQGNAKVLTA